ncbi:FUSC family protein [Cereibacter sp. SYSU M97828]|nr:FUSC family protein [Cereibacter flavus]
MRLRLPPSGPFRKNSSRAASRMRVRSSGSVGRPRFLMVLAMGFTGAPFKIQVCPEINLDHAVPDSKSISIFEHIMKTFLAQGDLRLTLRLFAMAVLAIAVAGWAEISHPYWAAMPVWAMSQPTRGLVLERGAMRLAGTIFGAMSGVAILLIFGAGWGALPMLGAGVFALTSLIPLLRGALSYGPLMAAMTLCIVLIPSLVLPVDTFALALDRIACTLIGVLVGLGGGYFLTPAEARSKFHDMVVQLIFDGISASADLASTGDRQDSAAKRKVLHDLRIAIERAPTIGAGSVDGYRRSASVYALSAALLELLAAVRAHITRASNRPDERLASALRVWLDAGDAERTALERRLAEDSPAVSEALLAIREELAILSGAGGERTPRRPIDLLSPFRDARLAVESGLIAAITTIAATAIAMSVVIPGGEWAALGFAVTSIMFTTHPLAGRVAPTVLKGGLVGLAFALVYRLLITPHIDGSLTLVLSAAPFLLLGAMARSHPGTAAPAFDANQLFLLSAAASVPGIADTPGVWSGTLALALALCVCCWLFPRISPAPKRRAVRVQQRIRDHLTRVATSKPGSLPVHLPPHFFYALAVKDTGEQLPSRSILSAFALYRALLRMRQRHERATTQERALIEAFRDFILSNELSSRQLLEQLKRLPVAKDSQGHDLRVAFAEILRHYHGSRDFFVLK